jgi:heme oxygenase
MEAANTPTAPVAPPVPLHHQLRAHTAAAHARVDAGLDGGLRSAHDYSAYLEGMAEFIDAAIAVIGAEAWLVEARHRIADDLGRAPSAPRRGAGDALADPARVAGWRYVVAGSTLGARLLLRDACAIEGGAHRGRIAFLSAFATGGAWPGCLAALRDAGFDPATRSRACDAALEAFHAAEAALSRARSQLHAA